MHKKLERVEDIEVQIPEAKYVILSLNFLSILISFFEYIECFVGCGIYVGDAFLGLYNQKFPTGRFYGA